MKNLIIHFETSDTVFFNKKKDYTDNEIISQINDMFSDFVKEKLLIDLSYLPNVAEIESI